MSLSLGRIHKLAAMAPSSTFSTPPPHSLFPKEQETAQTDRNSICWGAAKWQWRNTGIWSPFLSGWCSSLHLTAGRGWGRGEGAGKGLECAGTPRPLIHFSHITPHPTRRCLERCTPSHTRTSSFLKGPRRAHSYQQSRVGQQIRTKAKEQRSTWSQQARLWQPAHSQTCTCACSSTPICEYTPNYSLLFIIFTLWITQTSY